LTDISNHDVSTGGDNPAIDASALQKILPARYRILKIVGQGGAGVVYKARDTVLDKDVAIKTLHRSASPNEILRFQREAQLAGSLNHPNVMGVLDFGVTEANDPYLVLEFVKGESLAARVKRKGALPIRVLKAISEIRALQLLELGETDVVEPQAIGLLQALPKLDTFGMHEVRINQDVLNNIAELRTLHKLDLNATIGCNGLDWTVLKKLRDLRELKLDKTELDERTLDQVAGLKTLHRLDLKCVKLSDAQVRRLISAKNLMKMNIFASKEYISDANLALLQKSKIEIMLDKDRSSFDDWKNGL
jgi:hypothetical protein